MSSIYGGENVTEAWKRKYNTAVTPDDSDNKSKAFLLFLIDKDL